MRTPKENTNLTVNIPVSASINYDSCKGDTQNNNIKVNGKHFLQRKDFYRCGYKTIIPAWIGTNWDYNGTTEEMHHNKEYCLYFVTPLF
jgi:hypothetical protein